MTDIWMCPRRAEIGGMASMANLPDHDEWRSNRTCSYCGSMHPDEVMLRLEAQNVTVGSTDKSYKIYLHNDGGDPMPQPGKFYFQHFSEEQRLRFISLLNERKVKFRGGFGFTVLPYFIQKA